MVTLKVCVPADRSVKVAVTPEPVIVDPSMCLVMVQLPVDGKPVTSILPVVIVQVGCVTVPIWGATGAPVGVFSAALDEDGDVQPAEFVTEKVYDPTGTPVIVDDEPDPSVVFPPGDLVTVHDPVEGNPLRTTLPVGSAHVGWVIVPTTGAAGVDGWVLITIFPLDVEVQFVLFVTVYEYVPAASPEIVVDVPVPVEVVPPGDFVRVHVPVEGKPLSTTVPVASAQVGWVIVPTTGAVGVDGWVLITIFPLDVDVQFVLFVTVYVNVPDVSPEIVFDMPVPVVVVPPGDFVRVHVPDAGKPLRTTLPVASTHVGCVMAPKTGAVGVTGCVLIMISEEGTEVRLFASVTV